MKKKTVISATAFGVLVASVPVYAMPMEVKAELDKAIEAKSVSVGEVPSDLVVPENEWKKVSSIAELSGVWEYTEETKEDGTEVVVLTKYVGSADNTKVEIPRELDGKPVELSHLGTMFNGVTHVRVAEGDENNKVKLRPTDLSAYGSGFYNNKIVEYIDFSGLEVNATNLLQSFRGNSNLKYLNLSGWDVSEATSIRAMLYTCESLEYLNLSGWDVSEGAETVNFNYGVPALKRAVFSDMSLTTYKKIKASIAENGILDVTNVEVGENTSLEGLFRGVLASEIIGLDTWDTSNITNMKYMFQNCTNLTDLSGIENWNVENVETMESMFRNCGSLTELNLGNWNAQSLVSTNTMFSGLALVKTLDLTGFNMENVTQVPWMFQDCSSLTEIKGIETWVLGNVDRTNKMFANCTSLNFIDLSSLALPSNATMSDMFTVGEDASDEAKKLFVLTNDERVKEYDFKASNRISTALLTMDADGGEFEDGESVKVKERFTATVEEYNNVEQAIQTDVENFETPSKDGYVFVGWEEVSTQTNNVEEFNANFIATWIENEPTTLPDDVPVGDVTFVDEIAEILTNTNTTDEEKVEQFKSALTDKGVTNVGDTSDDIYKEVLEYIKNDIDNLTGNYKTLDDIKQLIEDIKNTHTDTTLPDDAPVQNVTFVDKVEEFLTNTDTTDEEKVEQLKDLLKEEGVPSVEVDEVSDEIYEEVLGYIKNDIDNLTGNYKTLDDVKQLIEDVKNTKTEVTLPDDVPVQDFNFMEKLEEILTNTNSTDEEKVEQFKDALRDEDEINVDDTSDEIYKEVLGYIKNDIENGTNEYTTFDDIKQLIEDIKNTHTDVTLPDDVPVEDDKTDEGEDSDTAPPTDTPKPPVSGGGAVQPPVENVKPEQPPVENAPTNGIENLKDLDKELQEKVDSLIAEVVVAEGSLSLNVTGDNEDIAHVEEIEITEEGIFAIVNGEKLKFGTSLDGLDLDLTDARAVRTNESDKYSAIPHENTEDGIKINSKNLENVLITSKVSEPFVDVDDSDWFKGDVEEAFNYVFTTGTTATTYSPHTQITRAQFAVMIARALELTPASQEIELKDLEGQWYQNEAQALYEAGIIKGFADGTFGGGKKLTRQQAVAMIGRMLEYTGVDTKVEDDVKFADMDKIGEHALDGVKYLALNGVLVSGENTKFNPYNNLTRAQMAKILVRSLKLTDLY